MSDQHDPSGATGLLEFFRPQCPVCSVTDWYPLVNDAGGGPALLRIESVEGAAIGMYAIACRNCRYVRFMAADAFDRGEEHFLTPS